MVFLNCHDNFVAANDLPYALSYPRLDEQAGQWLHSLSACVSMCN